MNNLAKLLKSCRGIVSFTKRPVFVESSPKVYCKQSSTTVFIHNLDTVGIRTMSQKAITSFFTITPKKTAEIKEEVKQDDSTPSSSPTKNMSTEDESPVTNGKDKRSSKRQRELQSSDEESQSSKPAKRKSSPNRPEKKTKRQRIKSSESEPESPVTEEKMEVKLETKVQPKTYASPKSKKTKGILQKDKKSPLAEKRASPEKNGKQSPAKKSPTKAIKEEKSPTQKKVVTINAFFKKENGVSEKKDDVNKKEGDVVPEEEYNPAKPKYHPINDACWTKGQAIPYLALAKTLEAIEGTSARLKIVEILANFFRSVLALTPEDLLPCVYLCLNQLAPAYHSLELGMAETYLMKTIGQCTGRTLAQVKSAAQKTGDLGLVAEQARATQRTMFPPPPLVARKVFAALKEVAQMTGQASVNKKIAKIQSLYIACRHSEARYLIRSLEGKLRIGLAEQSVLQALAVATTLTPPGPNGVETLDASKGLSAEQLKAKIDEQALTIKTTYCECPNYELIIPALLQHGVAALPHHCKLTPGIPLKPMLAHPTKGLHEVFNRFENQEFTCEWKYDGERAQIHIPGEEAPDYSNASIFSRNQENNSTKYPDIVRRLPGLMKDSVRSAVLDTEAVAYDVEKKQILPFQILSTRKRKDANEADIKVQVCVFVFDLLYLNGRALVGEPLAERRRLLREHFHEVEGEWQFATSKDCTSMEEVQQFLDESIKGSCEGLMVKMLNGENSRYDIARRSHNWLKLKKDYLEGVGDSIDAVVIGAYLGKGKRTGVYGGFLLACSDGTGEEYQALCKIGTGFTDEGLKARAEELEPHVVSGPKSYYRYDTSHTPDIWFEPACVWEVRCADLSLSPAHRAAIGLVDPDKGISLRFPRFIRVRDDKTPEQATTAQQIASMYLAQDQVKNTGTKIANIDDFY